MSRGVASGFATALAAGCVNVFPLIDLALDSGTDHICGLAHDVTYGGNTYTAGYGLVSVDVIKETGTSIEGVKVVIAGVLPDSVSLALQENVQGRTLTIRYAVIDSAGALQVDDNVWTGPMDSISLSDGADGSSAITVTAEHRLSMWQRVRNIKYTDSQQQALFAGDLICQYTAKLEQQSIVWPGAAALRV